MDIELEEVFAAFPLSQISQAEPYGTGRVHKTYLIKAREGRFILQKLNPAIPSSVMEDIQNVSVHVAKHGITVPSLIMTRTNELTYIDDESHWRLMTYIDGVTIDGEISIEQAKSAGETVGRFHAALTDYDEPFTSRIPQVQNPLLAFQTLEEVSGANTDETKRAACEPLAKEILAQKNVSGIFDTFPLRALHGDPKLSNILFDENHKHAIALIDLDTLGLYHLPLELGDMLRSFCTNPKDWTFSADIWRAILDGYFAQAAFATEEEHAALPDGFELITLSLAARYLTDAYEEKYFSFNPKEYASLYEQNLSRARSYMNLLENFRSKRAGIK